MVIFHCYVSSPEGICPICSSISHGFPVISHDLRSFSRLVVHGQIFVPGLKERLLFNSKSTGHTWIQSETIWYVDKWIWIHLIIILKIFLSLSIYIYTRVWWLYSYIMLYNWLYVICTGNSTSKWFPSQTVGIAAKGLQETPRCHVFAAGTGGQAVVVPCLWGKPTIKDFFSTTNPCYCSYSLIFFCSMMFNISTIIHKFTTTMYRYV